ncbi:MAG: hypothetical protein ACKOC8_11005 [Pirellulales bacterium]
MSQRRAGSGGGTMAAVVLVLAAGHVAAGQVVGDVTAGIGGFRRTGSWTPLVVAAPASAAGGTVRVAVEDPEGQFVRSLPAELQADGDKATARFSVRFGRPTGRVRVERTDAGGPVVHEADLGEPIASTDSVLLVYGDLPAVTRAARLLDREQGTTTRVLTVDARREPAAPGMSARDFDIADAIVICGASLPGLSADLQTAIDGWLRGGGRLLLLAGESAAAIAEDSPAAAWLPGRVCSRAPLRRLEAVESYARVGGLAERLAEATLQVPVFDACAGVVDVNAGDGAAAVPFVVRRSRGFGTVTWVGCDLDAEALRGWKGGEAIVFAGLGGRVRSDDGDRAASGDLAGQLRAALDTFPSEAGTEGGAAGTRRPVPFELVAAIGMVYVLLLHPLDWWLVSRSGRPWLSWLTLPAAAIACTGVAAALATAWGGGREAEARTAEVLDIDAESRFVRGTSWAAVLSPGNDTIDVQAAGGDAWSATAAAVSWMADAGRGFAGMETPLPHPSLAAADYGYGGSLANLEGVPMAAASSRLFEVSWTGEVSQAVVQATLHRTAQGTLGGSVSHRLPFALRDCRLLHAGWLYDVGTLETGQSYDTAAGRGPRSLISALTRRSAVKERESGTRWDEAVTDVDRILEVAAFHAAAGGTGYTARAGGRLARLDLSPVLPLDRAVLIGLLPEAEQATVWRLVLGTSGPVEPVGAAAGLCRIVIPLVAEPAP